LYAKSDELKTGNRIKLHGSKYGKHIIDCIKRQMMHRGKSCNLTIK